MNYKNSDYIMKLYDPSMKDDLQEMLVLFVMETFPEDSWSDTIDAERFANAHTMVYILYKDDLPIAFTSFCYNDYYGLREPTIGNTYLFVKKNHRRSIAFHLLSIQAGKVIEENDFSMEHYYAKDSMSNACIGRMEGRLVYQTYEYKREVVIKEYKKLRGRLK